MEEGVGWMKTYQNLSQWPKSKVMVKSAANNVTRLVNNDTFANFWKTFKLKTEAREENMYEPLDNPMR